MGRKPCWNRSKPGCPGCALFGQMVPIAGSLLSGWVVEIVMRVEGMVGFQVSPRRWVVERTFGWLNSSRRLSKDYEYLPKQSEAMIQVAMIRLMLKRLAPAS